MIIKWIIDEAMEEDVLEIRARKIDESLDDFLRQKHSCLIGYQDEKKYFLSVEELVAVVTENRNVILKTKDRSFLCKNRLYEIEQMLSSEFIRISQSEFVRADKIRCFYKTGIRSITLELENGLRATISRRYLKDVKQRLEEMV